MNEPEMLAVSFWSALADRDVTGALSMVDPDAPVHLHASGAQGSAEVARSFWQESMDAFPDLLLEVLEIAAFDDGRVLSRVRFDGTQAADFQGAINQEKHLDIEQAWLMTTQAGRITAVNAYWDQNKLYRRLAVKRLDQVAIA